MKKRVFAALLALAMALTLLPMPAFALDEGFTDVSDAATLRSVEVLRLMGVISGDGNGMFRPYGRLTRAEFCKMAVELQGKGNQVVRYRSRTIFPDVRSSHWAAGYVNFATTAASEKEPALLHGFPDGRFLPDQNISYGEAVTVLMRVLGYSDADSGGVWPQGYLDLASAKKLTEGLSLSGDAAITRAQAAKLFVNALSAERSGGGTLYKLSEKETTLLSVDLANGVMRTADGSNPVMVHSLSTTALRGLRGRVVLDGDGKALTFLPSSDTTGSAGGAIAGGVSSDAAVIVMADGSTAGFDALSGGKTNYAVYRNGARVTARSLRKYDVATYSAESNAILVCSTRVSAYYESCTPSPSAPATITALAGTEFNVISTSQQSLAAFKPGDLLVLLLSADGQIAGAVKPGTPSANANASGYVDSKGRVLMFCGASLLELKKSDESKRGQVVNIGQQRPVNTTELQTDGMTLTQLNNKVSGALDLTSRTVGTSKLADNVLALEDGVLTSLSSLGVSRIEPNRILYVRRNDEGEVDLVVLGQKATNRRYGRAVFEVVGTHWEWYEGKGPYEEKKPGVNGYYEDGEWKWGFGYGDTAPHTPENGHTVVNEIGGYTISIDLGGGKMAGPYRISPNLVRGLYTGDFVSLEVDENMNGQEFANSVAKMKKSTAVPRAAWIGTSAATADGVTYSIAADTPCWNADSKTWFKDVETALDYGGVVYFYIVDGAVRVIEVHG